MISIKNDFIQITVKENGCELSEIKSIKSGQQFLHDGNEKFWLFHAPVLFPIVGRNKDDMFKVFGKQYPIGKHGFARTSPFTLEKVSESEIRGTLNYNEETLTSFPFKFSLIISHKLIDNKVVTSLNVKNNDSIEMPFGIGGHPALKCPINDTLNFTDYYLEFEENETANMSIIEPEFGFFTGETVPFLKNENKINLNYDLFKIDAVTFTDLKSKKVILKSDKSTENVVFEYKNFPYIAFWTKKDAPFVCVEPWFTHGDFIDYTGEHDKKNGMLKLSPKETFNCEYSFTINEQ